MIWLSFLYTFWGSCGFFFFAINLHWVFAPTKNFKPESNHKTLHWSWLWFVQRLPILLALCAEWSAPLLLRSEWEMHPSPLAREFEPLVLSRWHCSGRPCNLQEVESCPARRRLKYITGVELWAFIALPTSCLLFCFSCVNAVWSASSLLLPPCLPARRSVSLWNRDLNKAFPP